MCLPPAFPHTKGMGVMGVDKFVRFFRVAAGLHVDKNDLKRYNDFIPHKIHDLLLRGQAVAKANDREFIETWDLPVSAGLQRIIHEFRKLEEGIEVAPILEQLAGLPQLELGYTDDVRG